MHLHAITFRVHQDYSYQERYESLVGTIKSSTATTFWDEPTSFFLIQSNENSAGVADLIESQSLFADDRDLLLIVNLSQKGFTVRGRVEDADLHVLMKRR